MAKSSSDEKIKGMYVKIGGDTSEYTAAMKGLNADINSTTRNLNNVNKLLKLDPSNVEYTAQKQKLLSEAIEATKTKLDVLIRNEKDINEQYKKGELPVESYLKYQEELEKTRKKLNTLRDQTKTADDSTKKMGNEAKETSDKVKELGTKAKETSDKAKDLGDKTKDLGDKTKDLGEKVDKTGSVFKDVFSANLAVEGLKAIANAAKEAAESCAQVGIDFSSSMSNVAATMGMTAEQVSTGAEDYQKLENAARECGETTKYTASESADALNYLALAGYDVNKAVETLPKVLNLATASGMDLASCTDMVTDTMSALQLQTSDLDGYMDMMAKTAQKSNTTVAMLGEGILQCAGTVKSTGQDVDTMCTSLGILANNGIKGAEGGTHLRNMLLSLTSPTDVASAKLKELGVSVADSEGNIRDINDIFGDLNAKLSKLSDDQKTKALSDIFNKTDLSSVNAMLQGMSGSFDDLKAQVDNADGACQTMADTMNNNLKGKLAIMDSSLESLGITIFDKFSAPLEDAAEKGSELFSELTKDIKDGDLSDEFDDMGNALGDLVETGAKFAKGSLPILIDGIKFFCEHSNLVIGGLTGIATAMLTQKAVTTVSAAVTGFKELSSAVKSAKTATEMFNAVNAATPWGAIATLAGITVGGIVAYATSADDAADSTKVLNDEEQALVDSTNELTDSMKKAADQREEAKTDIEAEYSSYKSLADRIFELSDAESLSNDEKSEMKALVDQLNSVMPDLNLQIDDQTGKLLNNKDAVYECIDAKKEQLLVEAAQKDMVAISEDLYKAEQKRNDIEKAITENKQAQAKVQEILDKRESKFEEFDRTDSTKQWKTKLEELKKAGDELQNSYYDINSELKRLDSNYNDTSEYISEHASALDTDSKAADTNAEKISTIYNRTVMYKDGLHKVSQETVDAIVEMNKSYDEAVQKRTEELQNNLNLFDEFNGGAEISAEQLMQNLESNLDGMASWSDDIKTLADRGVNKGLIKTLQEAGSQSSSKIKALLSMSQPELKKYSDMWEECMGDCKKIATSEFDELRQQYDKTIETLQKRDQISQISDVWKQTGAAMMLGMQQGILSAQQSVIDTATSGANAVLAAVKGVYDIHSPSKAFENISKMNAQGEIQGWKSSEDDIIKAYTNTGDKILSENMRNTYSDTNRVARSVYNGSYAHSITQKAATSATENTQVVPTVRQMPETIHNVIVFPNGKVIAEETVPFIDVMLGERAARKKRGSAV